MNLCAKCARHWQTCCQKTEVVLTDGDIQRITSSTGRTDFWEYCTPLNPSYLALQVDDPNWLLYTVRPNDTRPQLKHQPSGDCIFLTPTGCALSIQVRPLVCRLYPYDFTEQGFTGTVPGCPIHLLEKGQTLFAGIGMNYKDAERWRLQLYQELRAGSVWHENRNCVRSA
jgi:Fe-S-cluster containining protein